MNKIQPKDHKKWKLAACISLRILCTIENEEKFKLFREFHYNFATALKVNSPS